MKSGPKNPRDKELEKELHEFLNDEVLNTTISHEDAGATGVPVTPSNKELKKRGGRRSSVSSTSHRDTPSIRAREELVQQADDGSYILDEKGRPKIKKKSGRLSKLIPRTSRDTTIEEFEELKRLSEIDPTSESKEGSDVSSDEENKSGNPSGDEGKHDISSDKEIDTVTIEPGHTSIEIGDITKDVINQPSPTQDTITATILTEQSDAPAPGTPTAPNTTIVADLTASAGQAKEDTPVVETLNAAPSFFARITSYFSPAAKKPVVNQQQQAVEQQQQPVEQQQQSVEQQQQPVEQQQQPVEKQQQPVEQQQHIIEQQQQSVEQQQQAVEQQQQSVEQQQQAVEQQQQPQPSVEQQQQPAKQQAVEQQNANQQPKPSLIKRMGEGVKLFARGTYNLATRPGTLLGAAGAGAAFATGVLAAPYALAAFAATFVVIEGFRAVRSKSAQRANEGLVKDEKIAGSNFTPADPKDDALQVKFELGKKAENSWKDYICASTHPTTFLPTFLNNKAAAFQAGRDVQRLENEAKAKAKTNP